MANTVSKRPAIEEGTLNKVSETGRVVGAVKATYSEEPSLEILVLAHRPTVTVALPGMPVAVSLHVAVNIGLEGATPTKPNRVDMGGMDDPSTPRLFDVVVREGDKVIPVVSIILAKGLTDGDAHTVGPPIPVHLKRVIRHPAVVMAIDIAVDTVTLPVVGPANKIGTATALSDSQLVAVVTVCVVATTDDVGTTKRPRPTGVTLDGTSRYVETPEQQCPAALRMMGAAA